jgi:hypothetical protein
MKDLQRQYGRSRSLGMLAYCILYVAQCFCFIDCYGKVPGARSPRFRYAFICAVISVSGFVSFQVFGFRQFCLAADQPAWLRSRCTVHLCSYPAAGVTLRPLHRSTLMCSRATGMSVLCGTGQCSRLVVLLQELRCCRCFSSGTHPFPRPRCLMIADSEFSARCTVFGALLLCLLESVQVAAQKHIARITSHGIRQSS